MDTNFARFLGQRTLTGVTYPEEYAIGGRFVYAAPHTTVDVGNNQFYALPAGVAAVDETLHAALVETAQALTAAALPRKSKGNVVSEDK
jgi:hypothetical protein